MASMGYSTYHIVIVIMVGPYPTSKNYLTLDTFCYSYFIDKNIFEPPSWNSEITLDII